MEKSSVKGPKKAILVIRSIEEFFVTMKLKSKLVLA
jgi:hypothetical protein